MPKFTVTLVIEAESIESVQEYCEDLRNDASGVDGEFYLNDLYITEVK